MDFKQFINESNNEKEYYYVAEVNTKGIPHCEYSSQLAYRFKKMGIAEAIFYDNVLIFRTNRFEASKAKSYHNLRNMKEYELSEKLIGDQVIFKFGVPTKTGDYKEADEFINEVIPKEIRKQMFITHVMDGTKENYVVLHAKGTAQAEKFIDEIDHHVKKIEKDDDQKVDDIITDVKNDKDHKGFRSWLKKFF